KLRNGDIVTAINGKKVETSQQLRNMVAAAKPGDEMTFTVAREGKTQDAKLKIGEQPEDMTALGPHRNNDRGKVEPDNNASGGNSTEALGLRLTTPSDEMLNRFGLADLDSKGGALVTSVTPHSLAAKAGLQPGDLITRIGNKTVTNAED